jgi:hypothetical protein
VDRGCYQDNDRLVSPTSPNERATSRGVRMTYSTDAVADDGEAFGFDNGHVNARQLTAF